MIGRSTTFSTRAMSGDEARHACPMQGKPPASETVVIAWDGSRATIASLQDLVVSRQRRRMVLVEVDDVRPSAADAAAWLMSHGSDVQLRRVDRRMDVGPALRAICETAQPSHCLTNGHCDRRKTAPAGCNAHG